MSGTVGQFSSSMMENHIPASVLDASNGFSAVVGQDGSQFVLSIGSDCTFRVSSDASSGCSPWTTQDAAAALLTRIGSGGVSCFAVAYDATTDSITIAVVLTDITSSGDQLFVAAGLPATAQAGWMGSAGISWTAVPFDSDAYSSITAADLNVSAITLMLTEAYDSTETPLAFATVVDPSNGNFRVYSAIVPPAVPPTGKTAWNDFVLPTDSNDTLAIAAGQPIPALGQGIYVLGTSTGGGPVLDFIPNQYDGVMVVSYAVPGGASAIASLVLPDLSEETGSTVSELYVAGTNGITLCPSGKNVATIEVIAGSSYVVNTTQLHVLTNYGDAGVSDADALVMLWGVNDPVGPNSAPQVFYSYALYSARDNPAAWSPVVILLAEAQAVTPILNSAAGSIGFLGITGSAAYTTTDYGASPGPVLLGMRSDPTLLTWQQSYLPVPSTNDYIRLQSYGSQLKIVAPGTGLPLSGTPLFLTTASAVTLIVNGQSTPCAAGTPTPVVTDATGMLTIVNSISGISAVPFSVTDADGDPVDLTVNGTVVAQPYDPTGTITSTLVAGITGDLTSLRCQASNAPSPSTYQMIDPTNANLGTASSAFIAINQNMPAATSGTLAASRGNAIDARVALARKRVALAAGAVGDENGVEVLLGDLVQWIGSVVDDVANIVVNAAEQGFQIVVTFVDGIFNAVVQTVEEAWAAVVSVFQWIGAEFEDVFRWLAFIFDWNEMKTVHSALSAGFTAGFTAFGNDLSSLQASIDQWFTTTEASLSGNQFSGAQGNIQGNVTSNAPSPVVAGTDLSTDPRVGWIGAQLKGARGITIQPPASAAAAATPADGGTLFSVLSGFGGAILSPRNQQSGSLTQLGDSANGGGSVGAAVGSFVEDIGSDVLTGMQSAIDDGFQYAEAAVSDAGTMLTQTINVPVLSGIYQDIVGAPPSVQDIICLCTAVIVTISYNLVSEGNLPDLQTYVQSSEFQGFFSGFQITSGKPVNFAPGARRMLGDGMGSAAAGVVGGLAILQGFSIAADYMGEQSDVVDICAIATIVETFCDFLSCCISAGSGGVDPDYADFKELGAGLRLILLIALLQAGFRTYFGCEESEEIAWGAEGVSTALGLWALVDILIAIDQSSGKDWLDMFVDVLALPSALMTEGDVEPYAPIVAVLRAFAAEGLGIAFINDALTA